MWFSWSVCFAQSEALLLAGLSSRPAAGDGREREGQLALALKVVRGVVAYVSGHIAKLSPDAVRIETPSAILGVRGTTLAMRIDGV